MASFFLPPFYILKYIYHNDKSHIIGYEVYMKNKVTGLWDGNKKLTTCYTMSVCLPKEEPVGINKIQFIGLLIWEKIDLKQYTALIS